MSLACIPRTSRDSRTPHTSRTRSHYLAWPTGFVAGRAADRLFDDCFNALAATPSRFAETPRGFVPKLDVTESDEAYTVPTLAIPTRWS